jgi:hypothetical protein
MAQPLTHSKNHRCAAIDIGLASIDAFGFILRHLVNR